MAVTGLILIAFLLFHMYGNLKVFIGEEAFNHYAEWLKTDMLYPIFPKGGFIWCFRLVMLAALVLHMWSAITLWLRAKKANPDSYAVKKRLERTYSSSMMRWGGIILAGFLVFHLYQFTIAPRDPASPYNSVVTDFSQWYFVLFYALWLIAVCMHVRHGFWSAFATLGANTSEESHMVLNALAWIVALLIYIGFILPPVCILFGLIGA
jgi:succinate dehydrogenase / fumarate reductase cytochrome b subunit